MEYGSIEREIYVDASPEVVYEVISKPEHMREWWPDDARFEPAAGSTGELSWRNAETGETTTIVHVHRRGRPAEALRVPVVLRRGPRTRPVPRCKSPST